LYEILGRVRGDLVCSAEELIGLPRQRLAEWARLSATAVGLDPSAHTTYLGDLEKITDVTAHDLRNVVLWQAFEFLYEIGWLRHPFCVRVI
jgi:hypothetical protein